MKGGPPLQATLKAWQDCNRFLDKDSLFSINSPIAFNPDFLALSQTDFRKWSLNGLKTFSDMFDKEAGTVKSFSDIAEEYHIPISDFFKYLQVRHIIVQLKKKGQLGLCPTEPEQFIRSASSVKGKISLFLQYII